MPVWWWVFCLMELRGALLGNWDGDEGRKRDGMPGFDCDGDDRWWMI